MNIEFKPFAIDRFHISITYHKSGGRLVVEATARVVADDGRVELAAAEGDSPEEALEAAVRQALSVLFKKCQFAPVDLSLAGENHFMGIASRLEQAFADHMIGGKYGGGD